MFCLYPIGSMVLVATPLYFLLFLTLLPPPLLQGILSRPSLTGGRLFYNASSRRIAFLNHLHFLLTGLTPLRANLLL